MQPNLLLKVQSAKKDWGTAPEELINLRKLLIKSGYEIDWTPKKLGINLLTPNKIRGIVLKRALMKLYPFETFWLTETLDETLHKCLLVCQQLGLDNSRSVIWGQCSMNVSYEFWKKVLERAVSIARKRQNEDEQLHEAKSQVVAALIASRGNDWDKQISRNFLESMGKNRFSVLVKSYRHFLPSSQSKQRLSHNSKLGYHMSLSHRPLPFPTSGRKSELGGGAEEWPLISTMSFTNDLKKESQEMNRVLESVEPYYKDNCVLQIDNALKMGKSVYDLAIEFEGYMTANNRGAFKDVESLTNHTDKVIRGMSKLTTAYNGFFLEFQKYLRSSGGGGDELSISAAAAVAKLAEITTDEL